MTPYSPIRSTLAVAVALLIAALIASASARALVLGNIASQSALGQPLRVVIPIEAAPGEAVGASCFKIVRANSNSDDTPQLLTAKVNVERHTAELRLIVTTAYAIDDPIVRLTLQAGCEATNRRDYMLLFDPPANSHATAGPVLAAQLSPAQSSTSPTIKPPAEIGWAQSWLYLVAALGGTGILVLIILAIRLWRGYYEPAWIGGSNTSPSSITHVAAKPVTLPNFNAMSGFPVPAVSGRPSEFRREPETTLVDSLLGEIDDDLIEERAVREAWAAARREVESDSASNSILRAIDAAERDMQLSASPRLQEETARALTTAPQARTNFPSPSMGEGEGVRATEVARRNQPTTAP